MKISIITISFNQAKFLEETILSVLQQDYHNIQYIVVDPGSTDGSREIIERYRNNISNIIYEPDNGPSDGLNKGFAAADGEILGFLNSDDTLQPGALSHLACYFNKMPDVDVISGHSYIINTSSQVIRKFYSDKFSLWMAAHGASILSQASTFFRSNSFRSTTGFNINNRVAWDGELYVDMALNGAKFLTVNTILSNFRIHPDGITGSGRLEAENRKYFKRIFNKIVGHEPGLLYKPVALFAKFLRKFLNPRDTIERLLHGPIYRAAGE